jgi:hypothetical protein
MAGKDPSGIDAWFAGHAPRQAEGVVSSSPPSGALTLLTRRAFFPPHSQARSWTTSAAALVGLAPAGVCEPVVSALTPAGVRRLIRRKEKSRQAPERSQLHQLRVNSGVDRAVAEKTSTVPVH